MAMTWIWSGMVVLSLVFGLLTGRLDAVADAAMEGAASAVELSVSMAGVLCLWSGVMEIMNACGLSGGLARAFRPVLRRLMPRASRDEATLAALSPPTCPPTCWGWATPPRRWASRRPGGWRGAAAARCQRRAVPAGGAEHRLHPAAAGHHRLRPGRQRVRRAPFDILPAVWLASALSVRVGIVTAAKLPGRRRGGGGGESQLSGDPGAAGREWPSAAWGGGWTCTAP